MYGASLHADVSGLHGDHNTVVQVAIGMLIQYELLFPESRDLPLDLSREEHPKVQTDCTMHELWQNALAKSGGLRLAIAYSLRLCGKVYNSQYNTVLVAQALGCLLDRVVKLVVVGRWEVVSLPEHGKVADAA